MRTILLTLILAAGAACFMPAQTDKLDKSDQRSRIKAVKVRSEHGRPCRPQSYRDRRPRDRE
jgi:hypothetical protein